MYFYLPVNDDEPGYSLESKDELVDALPTLKTRAAEDDPSILFSVASDLSKVKRFRSFLVFFYLRSFVYQ